MRLAVLVALLVFVASLLAGTGQSANAGGPATVQCGKPNKLRLVQYEDGSARLFCARRTLTIVGVPW